MPASQRSFAVTDAYRRRLFGIRDRAEGFARREWPSIENLDGTDWPERMAAVLTQAQAEAVRASGGYLSAYLSTETSRRQRGPTLDTSKYAGLSRDGRALRDSLISPLIGTRTELARGMPADKAIRVGRSRAVRMVEMDLMNAARTALRDGMAADDRVEGWQRAVAGTCGACAGDIEVEVRTELPSVELNVHPNCQCVTVPVVSGVPNRIPLPTGRELFERLTPAEQAAEFGEETAEKLREGEIHLRELIATSPLATSKDFITQRPISDAT